MGAGEAARIAEDCCEQDEQKAGGGDQEIKFEGKIVILEEYGT